MAGLVFKNLMDMKLFNDRRIAIYYLNNLHPMHDRFALEEEDIIKQLILARFISASEVDEDIIEYFKTKLKNKPSIQNLAKRYFIHKENSHTFTL